MTQEQRLDALERQVLTLTERVSMKAAAEEPTEYYTSRYSGEEIDSLLDWVKAQQGKTT
jgi:transcription initiation factor IIE alpha subunit|uniref:Uncharacterized protein n=1 Tax=Myoviridae sp. ctZDd15 TaxID=2826664 RepID=A0A8S5M0K5_9CAUD|nr:MAG TPA: hypothetical protein [Myoviridae sp. ctZDd15]DAO75082.1 MAG TPA: hypothetical protein [Caudoviricetes sp.]